jgi:hypothetical protein
MIPVRIGCGICSAGGQQELEEDNEREQGQGTNKRGSKDSENSERSNGSNNNLENNKNARENLENNKKARDRGSQSKRANGGKGSRRTESTTEAREAGIDENRYDFRLFEVLNGTTIRMTDETGYKFGANDGHH